MLYACVCVYIADNRQLINTQLIPTAYGAEKKTEGITQVSLLLKFE